MKFTDLLTPPKEAEEVKIVLPKRTHIQESSDLPEDILRDNRYKIKLVTPTKFGTQIDFMKKYEEDEIQELLKKFTLKFSDKSVFVID